MTSLFSENRDSLPHRLSAARIELRLGNSNERIYEIIEDGKMNGTITDFEDTIKFLEKARLNTKTVLEAARSTWPLARVTENYSFSKIILDFAQFFKNFLLFQIVLDFYVFYFEI